MRNAFLHAFTEGICVANEHSTGALKVSSNAKCITHVNYPFEFILYGRRRNDDDSGGRARASQASLRLLDGNNAVPDADTLFITCVKLLLYDD